MEPRKHDLEILNEFRHGFTENLHAVFQPQIDLNKGIVIAAEALVRWHSPTLGVISPMTFIPLLENAGLINHVTYFMIDEAIRITTKLRRLNRPCTISVNISALCVQIIDLPRLINDKMKQHGALAEDLKLELTETAMAENPKQILDVFNILRNMGIKTAIDDFGTGYSSLFYLSSFPVDEIKIDKHFVQNISLNSRNLTIVKSTIALAHALNLIAVAEGVEDAETMHLLKNEGCDRVQGYYISIPLTESEFIKFDYRI